MTPKQTYGHLSADSDRARDWLEVYGTLSVPLISPVPVQCEGPFGVDSFYKIAVDKLSDEQCNRAIAFIARKFNLPEAEVREGIFKGEGLPVLAEDITVSFDARLLL